MNERSLKRLVHGVIALSTTVLVVVTWLGATASEVAAYPLFVKQAKKFGAKDCTFCHVDLKGGEGWNKRGQWLISEKEKRKVEDVDVDWLKDYPDDKPADKKTKTDAKKNGT